MTSPNSGSPTIEASDASSYSRGPREDPAVFLSFPACGSPGPLLAPDTRMERFTIIRHLGSGRGAHVYLAHDDVRAHEVALKVADLRPELAPGREARMRREIDLRQRIGAHPNVLTLFEPHRIQIGGLNLLVLSMEYADGGDFRQWLNKTREDPAARIDMGIRYLLQMANGMLALHRAGVVHLDFKPENVLWVQGVWKVGDLDHAQLVDELGNGNSPETAGSDSLRVLGTPGYASPETREPGFGAVDTRADIYSLGVVLRETLRIAEYLTSQHQHADRGAGRPLLAKVLARCLKTDPNDRLQLVDHVIELLHTRHPAGPEGCEPEKWPRDDRRWLHARRCLAGGRVRDARRLCQALLDGCPYHPGARTLVMNMDLREHQKLETVRQLIANPRAAVAQVIGELREIAELLPNHEETAQLIAAAEKRIADCQGDLAEALTCLSSRNLTGFAEALDRAAAWAPQDSMTLDACIRARDLEQECIDSRRKIAEAVADQQYRQALRLTRKHRRLLAHLAENSRHILDTLDGRAAVVTGSSS